MELNKSDVRLSKRLSSILRHNAVREGLTIKADGFVSVAELLSKSLTGYTVDDITRVVNNNDKQRFTLNVFEGSLQIKANQGHSITEVNNLHLKLVENPDFDIIHGTYLKNWEKIKVQGLSRMNRNHIHFAKGLNNKCGIRRNAEVFIYIDYNKATIDNIKFYESSNGVILCSGDETGFIDKTYFLKAINRDRCELHF